jgi:hypothetical protein
VEACVHCARAHARRLNTPSGGGALLTNMAQVAPDGVEFDDERAAGSPVSLADDYDGDHAEAAMRREIRRAKLGAVHDIEAGLLRIRYETDDMRRNLAVPVRAICATDLTWTRGGVASVDIRGPEFSYEFSATFEQAHRVYTIVCDAISRRTGGAAF